MGNSAGAKTQKYGLSILSTTCVVSLKALVSASVVRNVDRIDEGAGAQPQPHFSEALSNFFTAKRKAFRLIMLRQRNLERVESDILLVLGTQESTVECSNCCYRAYSGFGMEVLEARFHYW